MLKKILILLMCIVPFSTTAQTDGTPQSDAVESETSRPAVELDPVTVEGERIERKPKHILDDRFIQGATGSAGDPLRVLNHLPSIGVLNDFVGVLSVRGGGPEDNLYYFDRLPLGYPYHLFGIVSIVNADVIENIEVYPGGFGAEFGADSQAVIDIHSRTKTDTWFGGNSQPQFRVFASLL